MVFFDSLGVPPNLDAAEGAVAALAKVCEDSCEALATYADEQPLLGPMLATLIPLFTAPHAPLRKHALSCVNSFLPVYPGALEAQMGKLLAALDAAKTDPSAEVRRLVCQVYIYIYI